LAVPAIGEAVAQKSRVMAVSPLIGGSALKGPAHRILTALGYGTGTSAVIGSYGGLLTDIVIDNSDADDAVGVKKPWIHVTDTRMPDLAASTRLAQVIVNAIGNGG
jgi:LPPG:FO 2-phospho-L-lactate transferase